MNDEERELKNKAIIDFRYGIIAELLNPYLNRFERRRLIKEKVKRKYDIAALLLPIVVLIKVYPLFRQEYHIFCNRKGLAYSV